MSMTPRMQLSADVPVSQAFRAEINRWMLDFFGYEEEEKPQPAQPPVFNDANMVSKPVAVKAKRPPRSKQKAVKAKTLTDLLNSLESSFTSIRVPEIKGSWLEKHNVRALRKLGVYVPDNFDSLAVSDTIGAGKRPAIASAYLFGRDQDTEDRVYPRFVFAIKAPALPSKVERIKGTPYQFGMCYEMSRDEGGKSMAPRTFWAWCWIVVKDDGSVAVPNEYRKTVTKITHRRGQDRHDYVSAYQRTLPPLMLAEEGRDQDHHVQVMKAFFVKLVTWWNGRESRWSVGVHKDGHRCTFAVDPVNTSAYFADRNAVINENGSRKRIIHYVSEHERGNGIVVKAHIRGLREFDWHGYHCVVTAPTFNGVLATTFNLEPAPRDYEDRVIDTEQLAEKLALIEEAK